MFWWLLRVWGYTVLMHELFRRLAHKASYAMGSPWAFVVACLGVALWAASGFLFNFSNTWQLVINTGTTILTFLMVFLIQNTQNRDGKATQLKLDELINAIGKARNNFIEIEDDSDEKLDAAEKEFESLRNKKQRIASIKNTAAN